MRDLTQGCFARIGFVAMILVAFTCVFIFGVGVINNGLQATIDSFFDAPRDLFCSVVPFCDTKPIETRLVDERIVWTRIHERAVLDVGSLQRRGDWSAERTTMVVTHSKNMSATVNITFGLNLMGIEEDDVQVDQQTQTVTVTLPPVQPVQCFITDEDFYGGFCIEVCDDLERDLRKKAIERTLDSEDFSQALLEATTRAQQEIASLIDIGNIADIPYNLVFQEGTEPGPEIPGANCPAR